MEYVVFTDESYISAERYRSIGALSLHRGFYEELNKNLQKILEDSGVKELKWQKIKSAKHKLCAKKTLEWLLPQVRPMGLRFDVLVWDTHDSRHDVQKRDDTANFERMFFHLLKFIMLKREKKATWHIRPDRRSEINWDLVNECLQNAGKWREIFRSPLFGDSASEENYQIKTFRPIDSKDYPCCQTSDLLAGLAVFSINHYTKFIRWRDAVSPQLQLLDYPNEVELSNKELCRFELLKEFIEYCKTNSFGVSLETRRRLSTPNPNNPINFWLYGPQRPEERAPVKL